MSDALERGDLWDLPGGKIVRILGGSFLWAGVWWVPVDDHDFDRPCVMEVARLQGGWRRDE